MVQLVALHAQPSPLFVQMLSKMGTNTTNVPREVPSPPQLPRGEGANIFKTHVAGSIIYYLKGFVPV